MKKYQFAALLLAFLVSLCACTQNNRVENPPVPPSNSADQQQNTPNQPQDTTPDTPSIDTGENTPSTPPALEKLTVELVVEWEAADAILSQLDDLADILQDALDETGCAVDRVTITISTAGGFTAQALTQGGVDAAILPAADYISCENDAAVIALSSEKLSETAIAVSKANPVLNEAFCSALFRALAETEAGGEFLTACCPGSEFAPPTEKALQLVRDYVAELAEKEGGHSA